jgi:hypothetical protein
MLPSVQACALSRAFAPVTVRPKSPGTVQCETLLVVAGPLVVNVTEPAAVPTVNVAEPAAGVVAVSVPLPARLIVVTASPAGTVSRIVSDVPLGYQIGAAHAPSATLTTCEPPALGGAAIVNVSGPVVTGRAPCWAHTAIVPYGWGADGCPGGLAADAAGASASASKRAALFIVSAWALPRLSQAQNVGEDSRLSAQKSPKRAAMKSSMRYRLGLVAVLAAASAGCGSTSQAPAHAAKLTEFRNSFVQFRYPTAWAAAQPNASALHFHPMLYLSVQPTRNPCAGTKSELQCGWPVSKLRPGGVLVVWENRGFPGWSLASAPGRPTHVGGRSARRQVSRPGACAAIGADETVQVAIERPGMSGNWTAVTACLRGPDVAVNEQRLAALLASTRFRAP